MKSTLLFLCELLLLLLLFCDFKERNLIDGKTTSNYQIQASESEQRKINALRKNKQTYTIEIFVFVDHASYKKWYKLAEQNRAKALKNIKLYFAHVIDEARKVYETVDLPGIWLTCDLIGYYIAENPTDLGSYRKAAVNDDKIDSVYALNLLEKWILDDRRSTNPIAPKFDVAIMFTGYEMLSGDGYGFLSTACTDSGISIVEDSNYFFSLHTTVHEIGHNLGIQHDGEVGCNDDDSYIMSATKLGMNIDNLFKFSYCSIREFQKFFYNLKSKGNNCFLNKPSSKNLRDIRKLKFLPGLQYTQDDQCRIYYGESSSMCRQFVKNERDYSKICENIFCWYPAENACWSLTPADGTSCGDNKWCIRKKCVYDSRAPVLDKKCPFGDYGGQINTRDRGLLKCSEIAKFDEYCKVDFYKSEYCCESCNNSVVSQHPKKNVKPEVKKPDKKVKCKDADWCSKQPFLNCYELKDTCCLSCKKKYNASKRGCEYGDSVYWCKDYTRTKGVCDDQDIRTKCCESCKKRN